MVPIENHGARATCKGTFVVQQILLLKLQHTCIHYDFGPKAMLSNAGLSYSLIVENKRCQCFSIARSYERIFPPVGR